MGHHLFFRKEFILKKFITLTIIVITFFLSSICVYADTHGGGGFDNIDTDDNDDYENYLETEREGFDSHTFYLEFRIDGKDKLFNHQTKNWFITNKDSLQYIWICLLKEEGGLKSLYWCSNPNTVEQGIKTWTGAFGYYYEEFKDYIVPRLPRMDTCAFSDLESVQTLTSFTFDDTEVTYDYYVSAESSIPILYKTFENNKEYEKWLDDGMYNLPEFPDQDYSENGFSPSGDTVTNEVYDLQPPLNVDLSGSKGIDIVGDSSADLDFKVTWKQEKNLSVKNWHTRIYIAPRVEYTEDKIWLFKPDVKYKESDYIEGYGFTKLVPTSRFYAKFNLDVSRPSEFFKQKCFTFDDNSVITDGSKYKILRVSQQYIKLRNEYYDETTHIQHYSNWVVYEVDEKGNLHAYVDKDPDYKNKDKSNIDDDNPFYHPDEKYDPDKQPDGMNLTNGTDKLTLNDFINNLRDAIDNIEQVPDLMKAVFGWLPSLFVYCIVVGMAMLVLLRVLGR